MTTEAHVIIRRVLWIAANSAAGTALGSAVVYVLGYLALRYKLWALGIAIQLPLVDERYLFAGAVFLVNVATSIPRIVLAVAAFSLLLWLCPPTRNIVSIRGPGSEKDRLGVAPPGWIAKLEERASEVTIVGIVLAALAIQFVTAHCFVFRNILLMEHLPEGSLLKPAITSTGYKLIQYYFDFLVAITLFLGVLFFLVAPRMLRGSAFAQLLGLILGGLIAIQVLLLPVNYGLLVSYRKLPKVEISSHAAILREWDDYWLLWEGKKDEAVAFLAMRKTPACCRRTLLLVPRRDVSAITILRYEEIMPILFDDKGETLCHCGASAEKKASQLRGRTESAPGLLR